MKKFELAYAVIANGQKHIHKIYVYAENKLMAKIEARRKAPMFNDEFEWVKECETK